MLVCSAVPLVRVPLRAAAPPAGLSTWTPSPAHVALLAPSSRRPAYEAFVSREPVDEILARIRRATWGPHPPGAWEVERLGVREAFGLSGSYNRWDMARVYGGAPVQVARGPYRHAEGLDTWTLFSPYPAPGLRRLESGTLLLVSRVAPL